MSMEAYIWRGILGIVEPKIEGGNMKDFYRRVKLASGKSILVNEFGAADVKTVDGLTPEEFVEYEAVPSIKRPERIQKRRELREFVKGGKDENSI